MIKPVRAESTPLIGRMLQVTPHQLREIAQRIDEAALRATPGENVMFPLGEGIFLCHQPGISAEQFHQQQRGRA